MNTRLLVAVLAVMALLLRGTPLSGQPSLRNLTGTVQDRHHEPLNDAVVEIENENTKGVTSYITDRSGRYSFKRIQGEVDYRVWFTYRGQRSGVRELSQFDDHHNATINLVLKSH
ncbi:carboxypeptidase-like regulatory domain-containing protein [Tunturibacter psychrotolerans]|uniref:Carboxypeptidase-like regulatory domain-containing protein n=1 Tax=Tunturiibacter psychrotolerans TaxID=3069686 RepID=A0AAU7ZRT9_9BACT